ncbi:hypothetical protein [Fuerstiella marisgermanici]|uniref:hypothetical protein n=1 Tax=Fuerstiella marisgermanici TaxID=1891926 RepID=UPI0011AB7B59|nr:hypothetical protein [Fuerstiella marisgermanici]
MSLISGTNGYTAVTDGQGYYDIKGGAVPGKYTVTVSKFVNADGTPMTVNEEDGMDFGQFEAMDMGAGAGGKDGGPKQLVPDKFTAEADSSLSVIIPDGGTHEANVDIPAE